MEGGRGGIGAREQLDKRMGFDLFFLPLSLLAVHMQSEIKLMTFI